MKRKKVELGVTKYSFLQLHVFRLQFGLGFASALILTKKKKSNTRIYSTVFLQFSIAIGYGSVITDPVSKKSSSLS
jgi:hypothetical protein